MKTDLSKIFNPTAFDRLFIRQPDDFSCAPAAFATAARLYGLNDNMDFRFFRKALGTDFSGTDAAAMTRVAKKHLPVLVAGSRVGYDGGIALGSLIHKTEGEEHCVLYLGKKQDVFVYYDPYDHMIMRDHRDNMMFGSKWSALLPKISGAGFGFWDAHARDNPYDLRQQHFWMKKNKVKFQP